MLYILYIRNSSGGSMGGDTLWEKFRNATAKTHKLRYKVVATYIGWRLAGETRASYR